MIISEPVIVLGAGASHGSRVGGAKTPPLDTRFLLEAEQIFKHMQDRGKNKERIRAWRSFKNHLNTAGLNFQEIKHWRLEQLSTFLEARSNLKGLQLGQGRPREFQNALDALKVIVDHVLIARGGDKPCPLHQMIFEKVKPKTIVSFNYDLIADQTLLQMEKLCWWRADYQSAATVRIVSASGKSSLRPLPKSRPRGMWKLIKLHGSINWEKLIRGEGYRLSGCGLPDSKTKRKIFDVESVPEHPYLIPPVAAKIEIKDSKLRQRWYSAVAELHKAKSWIIWGYSFPQTDTISQVLFRTALARNRKSKPVFVINPDPSVATRVKEVCQKVKVVHYFSMEGLLFDLGVLVEKAKK